MRKFLAIFVVLIALTVSTMALDKEELEAQISQCVTNQEVAHEAAELIRNRGYGEDNSIIRTASDWWWSEEYQKKEYKSMLEQLEEEESNVKLPTYLYELEHADTGYIGHPISLTEAQREKVLRACVGEQGMGNTFEIYVGTLQYIVDYVEYGTLPRSYDNIGYYWVKSTYNSRVSRYTITDIENNTELMEAYDFVINQGGRLFQHNMGGYWDDDDAAGLDSFSTNVRNTCGGGHEHEWVTCVNPNESNEWVRFWICTNRHV